MSHWPKSVRRPNAEAQQESVLEEAARLVAGKRGSDYGKPIDNHTTTANLFLFYVWRKYDPDTRLGDIEFDAEDVCWFNILQKCSRDANAPTRDNAVDVAGYAENLQMVRDERARRAS